MLSYETVAVTVAEADEYAQGRARVDWAGRSEDRCAAPRPGLHHRALQQSLEFRVRRRDGPQVMYAILEAARRELVAPGSLMPDIVGTERVLREKVGDLEVQYADAKEPEDARPRVPVIDGLLAGMIRDAGNVASCFLARA